VTLSSADLQAGVADDGAVGKKKRGPRAGGPKRRSFTAEYELRVVEEYERLTEPGAKGALLRREGLYHSHIVGWRAARDAGALGALAAKPSGPAGSPLQRRRRPRRRALPPYLLLLPSVSWDGIAMVRSCPQCGLRHTSQDATQRHRAGSA
jgi:hypothetical protein